MNRHGSYWLLKNDDDEKRVKHLYAYPSKNGRYELELPTVESMEPFPEGGERFESTRWFVPSDTQS